MNVTTGILWQGALLFAILDVAFVAVLVRLITRERFRQLQLVLAASMAIFFCILWGVLASYYFWDSVYSYVFPEWSRWLIPFVQGLLFAAIGLICWWLALRLPGNTVLQFCILGGSWGMISHLWAISRGILDKPPMLQGASAVAAVVVAIFEFIFYWCISLTIAFLLHRGLRSKRPNRGRVRYNDMKCMLN